MSLEHFTAGSSEGKGANTPAPATRLRASDRPELPHHLTDTDYDGNARTFTPQEHEQREGILKAQSDFDAKFADQKRSTADAVQAELDRVNNMKTSGTKPGSSGPRIGAKTPRGTRVNPILPGLKYPKRGHEAHRDLLAAANALATVDHPLAKGLAQSALGHLTKARKNIDQSFANNTAGDVDGRASAMDEGVNHLTNAYNVLNGEEVHSMVKKHNDQPNTAPITYSLPHETMALLKSNVPTSETVKREGKPAPVRVGKELLTPGGSVKVKTAEGDKELTHSAFMKADLKGTVLEQKQKAAKGTRRQSAKERAETVAAQGDRPSTNKMSIATKKAGQGRVRTRISSGSNVGLTPKFEGKPLTGEDLAAPGKSQQKKGK
jgi:hypothetical protein